MILILIAALAILAGLGKAVRDTIAHHWDRSIFQRIKTSYPKIYKWFESDWRNKPDHPIAPIWDGWHCGDMLSYLVLAASVLLSTDFITAAAMFIIFLLSFGLFYHKILLNKRLF